MSEHAFASLRPANALARLAFSDVYNTLGSQRQNDQADAVLDRMIVEPEQTRDNEIVRLRLEMDHGETSDSDNVTEPSSDTEREMGMVWTGYYVLSLQCPPARPERGWAVGKGAPWKTCYSTCFSAPGLLQGRTASNFGTLMRDSTSPVKASASSS
jgi:hypothetical protein